MKYKLRKNLRKMRRTKFAITIVLTGTLIGTSALVSRTFEIVLAENNVSSQTEVIERDEQETIEIKSSAEFEETEETQMVEGQVVISRYITSGDEKIMLRIAMAEAEGEGVKGKALIMAVVLNRVESEEFPDSIKAVVFQKNQFSTVADGGRYYTTEPDEECYEALKLIESGWDESQGATYFESCDGDSWHSRNLTYLYQFGKHKFYI